MITIMNMTTKTNMKSHIKLLAAAALSLAALGALAQSRSAYFMDNYTYNYQHNPAMSIERNGYVAFPALGNLNLGMRSNVGLRDFFYVLPNGKTTSFMNPEVSAKKFMRGIHNHNRLGFEMREEILGFGFKGMGGFNNVSINAVAGAQMRVPGSLFSFLKEGIQNKKYDIGRVSLQADAYAEIALNHSHSLENIVPGLKVGGTFKFLVGVANADVFMEKADLNLGTDRWTATTKGVGKFNVMGMGFKTAINKEGDEYVDDFTMDDFSPVGGYGMAFDLGATYRLNDDWDFALAFNDLGFINWKQSHQISTNGTHTFDSSDYTLNPYDFDAVWDDMGDDLAQLYQVEFDGNTGSRCRALAATMNVSARYTLPAYRGVTFGFLNTTRMQRRFAWTEFRLSAQVTPVKWFSAGINYGLGTFGSSFGWLLNIAPKGFNFFVGMDHTLGKVSKQGIPLNANAQLSMGLNFPF